MPQLPFVHAGAAVPTRVHFWKLKLNIHIEPKRCARLTLAMGVRFVSDLAPVRPTMTIAELTAALAAEESWLSESAAWSTRM